MGYGAFFHSRTGECGALGTGVVTEIRRLAEGWLKWFGPTEDISGVMFWRLFAGIIALAAVLRLWNLDGVSLGTDESITHMHAQLPLSTILLGDIDYHPPLGPALQHLWVQLFPDPGMARGPHALLGIGTVAMLMLCLKDLVSRRAALMTGALLAVTAGHIFFSQEARMYALLVFGLPVAGWGALGFSGKGHLKPLHYCGLYVIGSVLMIGAHSLGPILTVLAGITGLVACLDSETRVQAFKQFIMANIVLLVLGAPWALYALLGAGSHPGLAEDSLSLLPYYIGNVTGFPGMGGFSKPFEILFYLAVLGGTITAWLNGQKPLAVFLLMFSIVLVMVLAGLHARQPILANRVVLPIVIGFAAAAGVALADIKNGLARGIVFGVLFSAGLYSAVNELTHRLKWDDARGAIALIDQSGFEQAPILICRNYEGAGIGLEAPGKQIFFYLDGDVLEQTKPNYWQLSAIPVADVAQSSAAQIDARLGGGYLVEGGLDSVLSGTHQVSFIRRFCRNETDAALAAALADAGFEEKLYARIKPDEGQPVFLVFPMTQVTLYERVPATP